MQWGARTAERRLRSVARNGDGVQRAIEEWIDDPEPCSAADVVAQLEYVFLAVLGAFPGGRPARGRTLRG